LAQGLPKRQIMAIIIGIPKAFARTAN